MVPNNKIKSDTKTTKKVLKKKPKKPNPPQQLLKFSSKLIKCGNLEHDNFYQKQRLKI